jgi:voltage-dependent anion channel protein 2
MAVAFKDIGKACSDLLTKDYKTGKNTVELKTKTPNGITFTPSATKSGDKLDGSLKTVYGVAKGMEAEVNLSTSGVLKCTFEAVDAIAKGMTCKIEGETPAPGKGGLLSSGLTELVYKTGPFRCQGSFDFYKGDIVANASGTMTGLSVGAECGYSTSKSALSKYAAACQYVQPDFVVSMKLAEAMAKPGKSFSGAYYHKVSGDMQVGAELAKAAAKSDVDLAFGCQYKLDKDTTVKGKVDSDGKLFASFKQKLSPLTLLTLAAEIDTVNLSEGKHKFGMVMNLTP